MKTPTSAGGEVVVIQGGRWGHVAAVMPATQREWRSGPDNPLTNPDTSRVRVIN